METRSISQSQLKAEIRDENLPERGIEPRENHTLLFKYFIPPFIWLSNKNVIISVCRRTEAVWILLGLAISGPTMKIYNKGGEQQKCMEAWKSARLSEQSH